MNGFFAFLSRMKYINRWGLMHNSRYENLCEHSFETAYLANALANIENARFGGSLDAERITTAALFHDAPEIITGDMPTPVKYRSEELRGVYAKAEEDAKETLLTSLPGELREVYRGYLTEEGCGVIKAADKLSALIKCVGERQIGNRDFESAEAAIRRWLDACPLKSVKYFMENMLPAYTQTLDELTK